MELPKHHTRPSRGGPSVSFSTPEEDMMSIAASEKDAPAEAEGSAGQSSATRAAQSEFDDELAVMLLQAAKSIELEVPKGPSPERSRLDDWFLGAKGGVPPRPAPVPFFPEVHEELTKTWAAPFMARPRQSSSLLTTLDGGAARGYVDVPQVERAVAVHLCPQNAATWRNRPRLPSKACKLSSALAAKAYGAAGQAASSLHAMAILQVYQAKALKQLHEGSSDSEVMQELHSATDFALRATKVTARALGFRPRVRFLSDAQPPQLPAQSPSSPTRDPGQQVSAAHSSSAFLQSAPLSGVSPLPLPGCPTAGTSATVPLIPLARRLGAWLALPSPSRWLIRTVRLGYAIQFARCPPKFRGIHFTSVQSNTDASVLRAEIAVLLAKDAIEPVPPAEMKTGFYSPYFIVPRKSCGLRPILDLRASNRPLHRLPFRMLTPKRILSCVRCGVFHGSIPNTSLDVTSEWTTEGERLGYICNPRSLKEGTETLCPPATILNYAECWVSARLLSRNLNEWMHAAILYT
ncbi:hypothetical protein M9458_002788, partial [Cirrhinus mrigala]